MKVTKQYLKKLIKEELSQEAHKQNKHDIESNISINIKKLSPDYNFGQRI